MTEHSNVIGGSSASRRLQCPGSVHLEGKYGTDDPSEYAQVGTALHSVMEMYTDNWGPESIRDFAADHPVVEDVDITPELITYKLEPALEALEEIEKQVGGFEFYELEVEAKFATVEGAFGTVDVLAKGKDGRCAVIDYKFGDGVTVTAEGNDQLLFYATAALLDPDLDDFTDGVDEFVLSIIQPREHYEEVVTQTTVSRAELERFAVFVAERVKLAQDPKAPLKAGPHCRWCKAKPMCPALQQTSTDIVAVKPRELSTADLGYWLGVADRAEEWVRAVRAYAHEELERGVQVPGYKLVRKRATRRYKDEVVAEKKLRGLLGEPFAEPKLLSPAQAEKAMGKKKFAEAMGDQVEAVSSGNTMAPDTDKRPDVSSTISQLGDSIEKLKKEHATGFTKQEKGLSFLK